MNFALARDEAVSRKLSGSDTHSRCHGPVARSKSWIMPSSMVATCWRTALAAASISSLEIGLRFCGMVEDAPRPGTNGSDTSPNSVADMHHDVGGDLAQRAGDQAEQRHRFGDAVARDVPGDRRLIRPSSSQNSFCISRPPSPIEASVPAAPENSPSSTRGQRLFDALDVAIDRRQPDRGLVAEGDGQRLLQMGAARPSAYRDISAPLRRRMCAELPQIARDNGQRRADLQHVGRCP